MEELQQGWLELCDFGMVGFDDPQTDERTMINGYGQ
jgi:hypothetical protein